MSLDFYAGFIVSVLQGKSLNNKQHKILDTFGYNGFSFIMLHMLSVFMLNVVMLSVIMLSVVMLKVVMLSVVILSVVALLSPV